jgi:cation diffusion facilitator CzcD-associated flavoprotein CzcO
VKALNQKQTETDVIIIGGGQAALSTAYFLKRKKIPFIILDEQNQAGVPGCIPGSHCVFFLLIPGVLYPVG